MAEATRNINTAWVDGSSAESTMRRWFAKFRDGLFGLEDENGRGRNPSIDNDKLKTCINVKKLYKWIPHLMNEKQNEKRYEIASMLLNRNESNPFLNRNITCDEKWILNYDHKRLVEWIGRGSIPRYFPS